MIDKRAAMCGLAGVALWVAPIVHAQPSSGKPVGPTTQSGEDEKPAATVSVQPIECWWRTSTNAVRVSELFTIVLTCSVLESATTTVVPDRSRLDASVLQLLPFEITAGSQAADIKTDYRRFFQYEYTARYIGEDFGVDVPLPPLTITYRVQSRVQGDAIESRDREYVMPKVGIRVLSLVPVGADDIRDRPPESFREIEARRFRANVLRIIAFTLFGLSAIALVIALVRLVRRRRGRTHVVARLASDSAVLGGVQRELDEVRRRRQAEGWTRELAAQALAALRIAGSYALARPVAHAEAAPGTKPTEGQLLVRPKMGRGKTILVSGSVTAATLAQEMHRAEQKGRAAAWLEDLQRALAGFSPAVYGREEGAFDSADLDTALESGARALSGIRREHTWLVKSMRALTASFTSGRKWAWTR